MSLKRDPVFYVNKREEGLPKGEENDPITEAIIGCAYTVANVLGHGFLEKIYENAMVIELANKGLKVVQQHPIRVLYKGVDVGEYFADLMVEDQVVVELKAAKELDDTHVAQCLNYLKATGRHVCLLINFGKSRIEVRRLVL